MSARWDWLVLVIAVLALTVALSDRPPAPSYWGFSPGVGQPR